MELNTNRNDTENECKNTHFFNEHGLAKDQEIMVQRTHETDKYSDQEIILLHKIMMAI